MSGEEMFAPLSLTRVSDGAEIRRVTEPEWRIISPAPDGAVPPPAKHPKLGEPSRRWAYLDATGRVLGFVLRFDQQNGTKEIRPLVFAEHRKHGRQWRWLAFPKPGRPLYGLDRLAARPDAPVVVCEGEKSADAASQLLPGYVAVTSPGGSKAAKAANWSALRGRKVTIWRDADEAGESYAADVTELLSKLSPRPAVAVITPPEDVAEGWDAADALSQGWTTTRAGALVATARPASEVKGATTGQAHKPAAGLMLDFIGEIEPWHSPEDISYATATVDDHRENLEIGSRAFRAWLYCRVFEATGKAPPADAVEAAVRLADALALRGPCHPTWRRVGEREGKIYLDLCGARWRAVEIDVTGWRLVATAPCKFLQARGAEALPEPEAGEMIDNLREFSNVESDGDFRLICAFLAAALRPHGPYPVLMISGEQGSSKSTLARVLRALIDPNVSPIRSAPKEERDLIVSASNAWVLCYDNLSGIPAWLADAFCRLSTGGGFATRANYTDRDQVLFSGQRPIMLNGIGDLAGRSDLAERGLPVFLPAIPNDQRREESEFWAVFEAARPGILGALLDAVVAGLRHLPDTKLDRRPRMADFATFAEACGPGFGWDLGEFIAAYEESAADAAAAAAEASPLLPVIEAVLARSGLDAAGFDGTAAELLDRLGTVAGEKQHARWYPGTASALGSALTRMAGSCAIAGSSSSAIGKARTGRASWCSGARQRRPLPSCRREFWVAPDEASAPCSRRYAADAAAIAHRYQGAVCGTAPAVHNWITRKILGGAALTEDGKVIVVEANRQLDENLDIARSKATIAALREPSVRDQLLELELEQRRRRLAADRGIYIRTEGLAAEVVKGFQRFIASADNDLAGEIGLDNEGLAVLRASWRRFREREADVALAFAERLPEVLPDAAQSR
ncbi:MAG TPA: hypothetical protein VME45_05995 [Stellaceae bacterium]|nr:hypothetical protein [Stellaceae bacterium]